MNADHDFDRIAQAWLADGPDQLSDRVLDAVVEEIHLTRQRRATHVPWRHPLMNQTDRLLAGVAAVAAIGVLLFGGAVILSGPGGTTVGGPTPSTHATEPVASPSASPSALAPAGSPGNVAFTSTLNGFSVTIPSDWKATPATAPWASGATANWGAPELDELRGSNVRFVGTSQPITPAQSEDEWIQAQIARTSSCQGNGKASERVQVGDLFLGTVDQNGCPVSAADGSVSAIGRLYDILVVAGGRGYNFTMDGDVDHAAFLATLATVTFDPAAAFAAVPLPLKQTYTSAWYGYSIDYADGWQVAPATTHWVGWNNNFPASDEITPAGTDTYIEIGSQPLQSGTTFDAWMADFHAHVSPQVPVGCDGEDPVTWPSIPIGSQTGHLEQLCNAAEAVVEVGGRVYVFSWMNTTFTVSSHFGEDAFKLMLKTATFDPNAAVD